MDSKTLADKIAEGSRNTNSKIDKSWDTIYHATGNHGDFLDSLSQGCDKRYEIISGDFSLNLRVLNVWEMTALNAFVDESLSHFPYGNNLDKDKRLQIEMTLRIVITLLMATTPPMALKSSFKDYNNSAQLKFADLMKSDMSTLSYLHNEYQSLEQKMNPSLGEFDDNTLRLMVGEIKKQSVRLLDLNYSSIIAICDYLIQQDLLMDKLASSSFSQ